MSDKYKDGDSTNRISKPSFSGPNRIWAIGGGKGGIGKSFISSSLAICLARMGKPVTLVDLDLGSPNLHTCLGLRIPELSVSDFIANRVPNLNAVATDTDLPNLRFVSGFNDSLDIANMNAADKQRLIASFRTLQTPYVILDLGAGSSETTIDFFIAADQKIAAVIPEPTSIENAYRFIKTCFYQRLKQAENELGLGQVVAAAMDARNDLGIRVPSDLIRYVHSIDAQKGRQLDSLISDLKLHVILNQVRTRTDIEVGRSMKSVCRKYFGIEADYLGYVDHDNAVWQALRKKRPVVIEHPYSSIVAQFLKMTKNLINPHSLRAVV